MNSYSNLIQFHPEKTICIIEGVDYPAVGFGTFPLGALCTAAVEQAAYSGYRIIDTATCYENFGSIAQAFQSHNRSHFYLISKVWHDMQTPESLHKDLENTLYELQISYLDAYLLHWPNNTIPIGKTLATMQKLQNEKKIRHIGLSNVTVYHLKKALECGIPITWVQIEMHPLFCDKALLDFCKKHTVAIQAWAPLNRGNLCHDKMLNDIGKKHKKTASQVALRWIVQHECLPLPCSKNPHHIQDNLTIQDFYLSDEDMQQVDKRAFAGTRFRLTEEYGFGFTDEFDFTYDQCWPTDIL